MVFSELYSLFGKLNPTSTQEDILCKVSKHTKLLQLAVKDLVLLMLSLYIGIGESLKESVGLLLTYYSVNKNQLSYF